MKWKIRQAAYEDIKALQDRFALNLISARILAGRGVCSPDKVRFWLESDISFLHNPFLFEDMEFFCDRILQAVEDNEKVRVFGDRDVDGITSTALLVTELRQMGLDASYTVPMGDQPYGMTPSSVKQAIKDGVTLAITVDCGISCISEIDYAQSHGLDVLVTDHHIPASDLPPASAIIDPKVTGCGYPFESLAGVGVVAKCIWAMRFAQSKFYRSPVILLHSYPGNDTVVIEAARIENLQVTGRIAEEVVPDMTEMERFVGVRRGELDHDPASRRSKLAEILVRCYFREHFVPVNGREEEVQEALDGIETRDLRDIRNHPLTYRIAGILRCGMGYFKKGKNH